MADQTHPETPANPENRPNPDNPADNGNAAALGSPVRAGDADTADALLRELAAAYGVDTSYWGWDGVQRSVAAGTLRDVLAALGVPANGPQEQQRSLAESRLAPWRRILPPVLVVREGQETHVEVHVPHGSEVRVWIDAEDGSSHEVPQRENWDQPVDVDGVLTGRATFAIPGSLGLGWHTLRADAEGTAAQCPLVVTPGRLRASALLKDFSSYEHIPPESVGNERAIMVSQQAGKSNLLTALARHGIELSKDDPRLERLLATVKERESRGYSYDGADASFAILAHQVLGTLPNFFDVDTYRASVERRHNAQGEEITVTEAVVKIRVAGEVLMSVAEGNGPVNALDLALRKDLGKYSARIEDLELVDFKVRILDGGTSAVTRVLVESRDGTGERWYTIGVSPNIIDASFEALYESINYKLLKTEVH